MPALYTMYSRESLAFQLEERFRNTLAEIQEDNRKLLNHAEYEAIHRLLGDIDFVIRNLRQPY